MMGGLGAKNALTHGLKEVPKHKEENFKQNAGAFYGIERDEAARIDANKLYAASRAPPREDPLAKVPESLRNSGDF